MKRLILIATLTMIFGTTVKTQAQVNINVQIGTPVIRESWYATDYRYYYLPEFDIYYNPTRSVYIFLDNGVWVSSRRLPPRYGNFSYRRSEYVIIRDRSPFDHHDRYRQRYHDNGRHRGHYKNKGNRGRGRR